MTPQLRPKTRVGVMLSCGGTVRSQIVLKLWACIDDMQGDIPKLTQEIRDLGEDVELIDVEVAKATASPAVEAAESAENNRRIHWVHRPPWADAKSLLTEFNKKAGKPQQEPAADAPATWHKEYKGLRAEAGPNPGILGSDAEEQRQFWGRDQAKMFNDCKVERHRTVQGRSVASTTKPPRTHWRKKSNELGATRTGNSTWCVPSTRVESEDSRQEALNCSASRGPCVSAHKKMFAFCGVSEVVVVHSACKNFHRTPVLIGAVCCVCVFCFFYRSSVLVQGTGCEEVVPGVAQIVFLCPVSGLRDPESVLRCLLLFHIVSLCLPTSTVRSSSLVQKSSVNTAGVFLTRGCCGGQMTTIKLASSRSSHVWLERPRASLFSTLLHSLPYPLVVDRMCGLFRSGGPRPERHLRQPTATSKSESSCTPTTRCGGSVVRSTTTTNLPPASAEQSPSTTTRLSSTNFFWVVTGQDRVQAQQHFKQE